MWLALPLFAIGLAPVRYKVDGGQLASMLTPLDDWLSATQYIAVTYDMTSALLWLHIVLVIVVHFSMFLNVFKVSACKLAQTHSRPISYKFIQYYLFWHYMYLFLYYSSTKRTWKQHANWCDQTDPSLDMISKYLSGPDGFTCDTQIV